MRVNNKRLVRAPKVGYDSPEKQSYRDNVWRCFADMWGEQLADQRCMILPSREGLEIPTALRWGAVEERIVGVDDNPAVIATSPWRKAYPRVMGMGTSLARSAERLASDGERVGVVNLDLCNKFSGAMVEEIRRFAEADILGGLALVAVTLLKGREEPETVAALRLLAEREGLSWNEDAGRPFFAMRFMAEVIGDRAWCPLRWGEYRSGSKNMVWMVAATATHDAIHAELERRGWGRAAKPPSYPDWDTYREAWTYLRYRTGRGRFRHGPLYYWGIVRDARWNEPGRWAWDDSPWVAERVLLDQVRGQFSSADAAMEYFDGSGSRDGWVDGVWGESAWRVKERANSTDHDIATGFASLVAPWSSEWRNLPDTSFIYPLTTEYDCGLGVLAGMVMSKFDAPQRSRVTQPFNTWRISQSVTLP